MSKLEWGTKRTCTTCGARFYDLRREPIICPKCGAENEKDVVRARRGGKGTRIDAVKKAAVAGPAVVATLEEDDLLDAEDDPEVEEDLMEDTSDLGEDEEDMAEVMEHLEPGDEEE